MDFNKGRGLKLRVGAIFVYVCLLAVVLFLFFSIFGNQITGRLSLDTNLKYQKGEPLNGALSLILDAGELLPKSSKLLVSLGNETREFFIDELINERSVEGEFYVKEVGVLGKGEGYGLEGFKEVYPDVDFQLLISDFNLEGALKPEPEKNTEETITINETAVNVTESNFTSNLTIGNNTDFNITDIKEKIEEAKKLIVEKVQEEAKKAAETAELETEVVEGEKLNETNETLVSTDLLPKVTTADKKKLAQERNVYVRKAVIEASGVARREARKSVLAENNDKIKEAGLAARKEIVDKLREEYKDRINSAIREVNAKAKAEGRVATPEERKASWFPIWEEALAAKQPEIQEAVKKARTEATQKAFEENQALIDVAVSKAADEAREKARAEFDRSVLTGNAIVEDVKSFGGDYIISGKVTKDSAFIFALEENQKAYLIPGSAKANGQAISDSSVLLESSGNYSIISTEYFFLDKGFGEGYIDSNPLVLNVDFSKIDMTAEEGDLRIVLYYDSKVISSLTKNFTDLVSGRNASIARVEVKNFSKISDIPDIRIPLNSNYTINLSDYFSGAESYSFNARNISYFVNGELMTFVPDEGFRGIRRKVISAKNNGEVIKSNRFRIGVSSGNVETSIARSEIRIGERVKWIENVSSEDSEGAVLEIPSGARDVKIVGGAEPSLESGEDSLELVLETGEQAVEYYTDAPEASEKETERGKEVSISGPDDLEYTDIVSFTTIPEILNVGQEKEIQILWKEDNSKVNFTAKDIDGNGKLDYIEWITPHLSTQTFEIDLIGKILHLDSNRNFVESFSYELSSRDEIWKEIPSGDYIRVSFDEELNSNSTIPIYARSEGSSVEVYEKGGSNLLGSSVINENRKYDISLNSLSGVQDTFDLKVVGDTEFDYILSGRADSIGVCNPYFSCGDWGLCFNSEQQRVCADVLCSAPSRIEFQSCVVQCQSSWQCGEWSSCGFYGTTEGIISDELNVTQGSRTRTCLDSSGCAEQKTETESCQESADLDIEVVTSGGKKTLVGTSRDSGKPVLNIDVQSVKEGKLGIVFVQEKPVYDIQCYNGFLDDEEDRIDCGGACKRCSLGRDIIISDDVEKFKINSNVIEIPRSFVRYSLIVLISLLFILLYQLDKLRKR